MAALLLSQAAAAPAQTVDDPALVVETVISTSSLPTFPTSMAFLGPGDILITERQSGLVRRVIDGELQTTPVLDLAVNHATERGLLNIALDPLFGENRRVYLFYTRSSTGADTALFEEVIDQRISRFLWNGSTLTDEYLLLTLPAEPGPNHVGGILAFGPPNVPAARQKLFAVIGDMNRDDQTENFSEAEGGAPAGDSGCIIRINPDGTVPSANDRGPFYDVADGNATLQRLYGYGIRNSFGLAFDTHPTSGGALWDTENGTRDWDEINRIDPAFNGGWEHQQGPTGFPDVEEAAQGLVQFGGVGTYSDPEFSWRQIVAPTAIHFLSGGGLGSDYRYDCFVGTFRGSRIYRFKLNADRTAFDLSGGLADTALDTSQEPPDTDEQIAFGSGFFAPVDIKTGPDGCLYVLAYGNGQIYRIRNPGVRSSERNRQQFVKVTSTGGGYQELFFNYTARSLEVTPYHDTSERFGYELPDGEWCGIFHYDYETGRFTQALYCSGDRL